MSRYRLRYVALASVVAACVGLAAAVVRVRQGDAPPALVSTEPMVMRGFRSALYDGDRLHLRVSGDSITLSNSKVFGPFSLGFIYSLVGRNVTLETFPPTGLTSQPAPQALSLDHLSALVGYKWGGLQLGSVEVGPVSVVEHRDWGDRVILHAAFCRTSVTARRVLCRDGTVDIRGTPVAFQELTYDGEALRMTP
jgi:hypothetical protein